jgi:sigma-B regulation protein RsbU (phosphoserine phosphatase)
MRVLIAEDDAIIRRLLEATLTRWGHETLSVVDGAAAWEVLQAEDAPRLALLDWMMPEIDGVEICRRVRSRAGAPYVYILLLTARGRPEDLVAGLEAGADDYITKPFDPNELRCRLQTGRRIIELQSELSARVQDLESALQHVERLQGLLPICMHCKRIRDERDTWRRIEAYISEHSEVEFTHSLCEECRSRHYATGR